MKNIGFQLIVSAFLIFNGLSVLQVAATTQIDIPGPTGSGRFGSVFALPNGNIVVIDPEYDAPTGEANVGAIYLYNGATGALIRRLTEISGATFTRNLTPLPNGNFVLIDDFFDAPGVQRVGAVYLYNGATGALISRLTGSSLLDYVGRVTVLPNGNYVVSSPVWNNGAIRDVGAVTFCNGTTGCAGVVSAANSLVGLTVNDYIGSSGITVLTNGNYVVYSPGWNNGALTDVGAVTFCNGITGCTGAVSAANSLVGSTINESSSVLVTALTNGNYVVSSAFWDNGALTDVGAVTFCNGTSGCTGTRTSANSLVGSTAGDGVGRVAALSNGNYVVSSPGWDNGAGIRTGAVTFCNGTTGCVGAVSSANSLVGSTAGDSVGNTSIGTGLTALTNGNYVVSSEYWDNGAATDAGAVTLCNGTSGCTGVVSPANSLVGLTAGERIGRTGVTALTNGNYVVSTLGWDNGATANVGAATFCNGTSGCTGAVSSANSLIGSSAEDNVGGIGFTNGVTALTNGNYVVNSPGWNNGASVDAGAVTFCNGMSGCTGAVSSTNSLVGSSAGDYIGNVVVALTNGNYVVGSLYWSNGAIREVGAVTWCNGTSGCTGAVTSANSLVGSTAGDRIGSSFYRNTDYERITITTITALPNGNYVVDSPFWDNGAIINTGAITYGDGSSGTFGEITAANSLRGTTSGSGTISGAGLTYSPFSYTFDAVNNQLVVGRPLENIVTLFRPTRPTVSRPQFDFDGDGRADLSVFRPSDRVWYLLRSASGFAAAQFGLGTDKLAPADFDGDGRADLAVFRSGVWYILQSSNGQVRILQFGVDGDLPRPGDFDGDGLADVSVFRPSDGTWYRLNSSNGQFAAIRFGQAGDAPMLGDYDGDGRTDFAVFRPSNGVWYILRSSDFQTRIDAFGLNGDIALNGDFNGDGRSDLAVFRPSNRTWYIARPTGVPAQNFDAVQFGLSSDTPVAADYNGDGRTDIGVYRSGTWWIQSSGNGQTSATQFGLGADKPIPAAYLPE